MTAPVSSTAPFDVPWWARGALGAAAGALVGSFTAWAGRDASPLLKLLTLGPALAAINVALSDLGRRPLSPIAPTLAALFVLALTGCLQHVGAALGTILLGGWLASRLVTPGRHRDTRTFLLFGIGSVACPLATIGVYRWVPPALQGDPLPVSLAAFQLAFWLTAAGAESALSWSAGRARVRGGRGAADGLDPEEITDREARALAALAAELARRFEKGKAGAGEPGGEAGPAARPPKSAEPPPGPPPSEKS